MAPRVQPIHMDRETNLNNGLTERIGPQSWRAQNDGADPHSRRLQLRFQCSMFLLELKDE